MSVVPVEFFGLGTQGVAREDQEPHAEHVERREQRTDGRG